MWGVLFISVFSTKAVIPFDKVATKQSVGKSMTFQSKMKPLLERATEIIGTTLALGIAFACSQTLCLTICSREGPPEWSGCQSFIIPSYFSQLERHVLNKVIMILIFQIIILFMPGIAFPNSWRLKSPWKVIVIIDFKGKISFSLLKQSFILKCYIKEL